jgi:uncharacterized membrane protein (DUF485 family)
MISYLKSFRFYLVKFLVYSLIATASFLLVYFLRGRTVVSGLDGSFVACAVAVALALLDYSRNHGVFDSLTYGLGLFPSLFNKELTKPYKDLYEYREVKDLKRKYHRKDFYVAASVALIYLFVSLILLSMYYTQID